MVHPADRGAPRGSPRLTATPERVAARARRGLLQRALTSGTRWNGRRCARLREARAGIEPASVMMADGLGLAGGDGVEEVRQGVRAEDHIGTVAVDMLERAGWPPSRERAVPRRGARPRGLASTEALAISPRCSPGHEIAALSAVHPLLAGRRRVGPCVGRPCRKEGRARQRAAASSQLESPATREPYARSGSAGRWSRPHCRAHVPLVLPRAPHGRRRLLSLTVRRLGWQRAG